MYYFSGVKAILAIIKKANLDPESTNTFHCRKCSGYQTTETEIGENKVFTFCILFFFEKQNASKAVPHKHVLWFDGVRN